MKIWSVRARARRRGGTIGDALGKNARWTNARDGTTTTTDDATPSTRASQEWLNDVAMTEPEPGGGDRGRAGVGASGRGGRGKAAKAEVERRAGGGASTSTSMSRGRARGKERAETEQVKRKRGKGDGTGERGSGVTGRKNPRGAARLRWTPELHAEFLKAVHQLGGLELATPKGIATLMTTSGMTLQHIKSHLQKYRLQELGGATRTPAGDDAAERARRAMIKRARQEQAEELARRASSGDLAAYEAASTPTSTGNLSELIHSQFASPDATPDERSLDAILARASTDPVSASAALGASLGVDVNDVDIKSMPKVGQALLKQLEMQKQLHDQLLTQRRLETAIAEHSKYIASMLAGDTPPPS